MPAGRPRKRLITLVKDGTFDPYKHERLLRTDDWFERNGDTFLESAAKEENEHRLMLWMVTLAIIRISKHPASRDARRALAKAFYKATIECDPDSFFQLLEDDAPLAGWTFDDNGPVAPAPARVSV